MMPTEDTLFELASSQSGYFTAAQARACGCSWALLSHHAASGRFVRARRGLYRFRNYPSAPHEEVAAAWLAAGPAAVVSHESALDLLGLAGTIPSAIHLTVPRASRSLLVQPGVRIHTATRPPGADEVVTRSGMRVTAAVRTIIDVAAGGLDPDQVARAARQAIDRGLATPDQLLLAARQRGGRAWRQMSGGVPGGAA